ncbi:MAG: VOC family protein [Patescibacteria group bacterium]|nr:VOC family protein [Patescibacteria group bacterium]
MPEKATIKHIEFWVSDLEHAIKFYESIFKIVGWKKVESNAFSNGETKIYFIEQDVKLATTVGPRHICFLASSRKIVNEVASFLTKTKGDIIRGPLESPYKNRSSYTVDFRDLDGYIIEVATKATALKLDRSVGAMGRK